MLTKVHIENFKSIHDETIELGRVNVFIGENGSGKSNILEALALASAAKSNHLSPDGLALKGIRVAKPSITFSSFLGEQQRKDIRIDFETEDFETYTILETDDVDNILGKWKDLANVDEMLIKALIKRDDLTAEKVLEIRKELEVEYNKTNILEFVIFALETSILRGIGGYSKEIPGRNGENLDLLINSFTKQEFAQLAKHAYFISWLAENGIVLDKDRNYEGAGHKLNNSKSMLYFRDKFMQRKNNLFSSENANEGVLHILFYLALFISKHTPKFFAIDNIETALNPQLCRALMTELATLAKANDKQALITTHNPAILDGLNLHDDEQRLFVIKRNKKGHTKVERIQLKPDAEIGGTRLKLSELWMRNMIGGLPQNF